MTGAMGYKLHYFGNLWSGAWFQPLVGILKNYRIWNSRVYSPWKFRARDSLQDSQCIFLKIFAHQNIPSSTVPIFVYRNQSEHYIFILSILLCPMYIICMQNPSNSTFHDVFMFPTQKNTRHKSFDPKRCSLGRHLPCMMWCKSCRLPKLASFLAVSLVTKSHNSYHPKKSKEHMLLTNKKRWHHETPNVSDQPKKSTRKVWGHNLPSSQFW